MFGTRFVPGLLAVEPRIAEPNQIAKAELLRMFYVSHEESVNPTAWMLQQMQGTTLEYRIPD